MSRQFTAKSVKALARRSVPLLFGLTILMLLFQPVIGFISTVQAATPQEARMYETISYLRSGNTENGDSGCSSEGVPSGQLASEGGLSLVESLSSESVRNGDFFEGSTGSRRMDVPATLFGTDSKTCEDLLNEYINYAFEGSNATEKRLAFLRKYYNTSSAPYTLRANGKSLATADLRSAQLDLAAISGLSNWHDRIMSQAFNDCYRWTDDVANPLEDATDAEKFNKDRWERENSGNVSTGLSVEYIIEGRYDDGIVTCSDVMDYIFDDPANHYILSYGPASLQNDLDEEESARKIQDITDEFATDPEAFSFCVASGEGSEAFRNLPLSTQYRLFASYLVDGDNTRPLSTLDAATASAIASCLHNSTQFGSTITSILAREAPQLPSRDAESGEDEGDSCYDSVEPLFTIPVTGTKVPNPLKWMVCGISQLFASFIDTAGSAVGSYLSYNPFDDQGEATLKSVWGNILNVANILFVVAFLVMVLSTILDLGLFSNYTVKKLLPRIILAALLANLSWEICRVITEFTIMVGDAAKDVILAPLAGTSNTETSIPGQALKIFNQDSGAITLAVGALIYASLASAGAILLPVLATVAVSVLVAFVVLAARRVILVLLIVLAPLALVALAFPGGDSWAKRWWKLFIQLLFMYPIITALFASGIFLSSVLDSSQSNLIETLTQAFVLFMPFFALPYVFKMAGGALANITGMVNDRSKGLIDRSKKWRDENSQYGRRKQLKAQRKNYTGHENLIKSMGEEKLLGSKTLANRRRAQGLGRSWLQSTEVKENQRAFMDKMEASVSKEAKEAADYRAQAAGGGIEAKRRDGSGKVFRVIRAGESEKDALWLSKDAAVAEAWKGARVDAMKEEYDSSGNFKGYSSDVEGTLFDGSKAAQRAAGSVAGAQALTPVIDAVRNGDTGQNGWKLHDQKGNVVGTHTTSSFAQQFAGGDEEAKNAAQVAGAVMAEVKGSYAQNLSGKMPSFVKGESLAFGGIQAGALAGFHENEVRRLVDFAAAGSVPETWSRVGQSLKQIVEEPQMYNMSPKALAELKKSYAPHMGSDTTLDAYIGRINVDGTLN
jgi:hypothetical protein